MYIDFCSCSLLLSQLKPTAVARLGSPVLDIFLAQLAMQLNKTVGAVETDDEQCRAFNSLSDSLTVSILNSTLGALEKNKLGPAVSESLLQEKTLVREYLCGQFRINAFEDLLEGVEMTPEQQEAVNQLKTWINENLNTKRNKVMASRVIELLRSGQGLSQGPSQGLSQGLSHFFALGLGHFVGSNTIIDEVRAAGFVVERVTVEDDLQSWQHRHSGGQRSACNSMLLTAISFVILIFANLQ